MATMAAYVAVPAACKAVVDSSVSLLTAINKSREVPWISEALRNQLELCQQEAELIKLRLDSTGLPATAEGRQALRDLQATLIKFNRKAEVLKGLLEPAPAAAASDWMVIRMLCCCVSCLACCVCNCWKAAFPQKARFDMPALISMLHHARETAEKHGAFVTALEATFGLPPCHVARPELRDAVVQALEAGNKPGSKGVLITGFRGMGKTTLAQAVLKEFSSNPDLAEAFPDGVYDMYFGQPGAGDSPQNQVLMNQQLLLACLTNDESIVNTELKTLCSGSFLAKRLKEKLCGRKCLLLLDDVRDPFITQQFLEVAEGSKAKLLVTGLNAATAWDTASPEGVIATEVHISSGGDGETDRQAQQRQAFELELLARRSSGNMRATIAPEFEVQARTILNGCSGSALAIATAGRYLFLSHNTPDAWQRACTCLFHILSSTRGTPVEYNTRVSTFGTIQLVLSALDDKAKAVFFCLEPFRAGADIPLDLAKLAVAEGLPADTSITQATGHYINELIDAELVRLGQHGSSLCLLDLMSMFLTQQRPKHHPASTRLFTGPTTPMRELLAAFVTSFGHAAAAAAADRYLQVALQYNRSIVSPELSKHWQSSQALATQIPQPGGIAASKVAAAVVGWRAWAKAGAKRDELDNALVDAQLAVKLQTDKFTLQALAGIERRLGHYDAALEHINQALQLEPDDFMLHHYRNCVMVNLGQGSIVLGELDLALETARLQPGEDGKCAGLLTARGDIKRRTGIDLEGALADLNEADALVPKNDYTLTVRGDVLRILASRASDPQQAVHVYLRALEDLNTAAQLQGVQMKALTSQARGVVKWRLATFGNSKGNLLGARDDLVNSCQSYDDADIHIFLAAVQQALGNNKAALEEFRQAEQIINLPGNSFVTDSKALFWQLKAQLFPTQAVITAVAY